MCVLLYVCLINIEVKSDPFSERLNEFERGYHIVRISHRLNKAITLISINSMESLTVLVASCPNVCLETIK